MTSGTAKKCMAEREIFLAIVIEIEESLFWLEEAFGADELSAIGWIDGLVERCESREREVSRCRGLTLMNTAAPTAELG